MAEEIGIATGKTGLKGSSTGYLYEEFLPELRGQVGARQYREMADNDPVIGAMLFAVEMLTRNVDWRVEPADQTPAALAAAEWLDGALFKDMSRPFSEVIEDALTMLTFGYAPMEIVFKLRNGPQAEVTVTDILGSRPPAPTPSSIYSDGKIGVHRVFLLNQDSVVKWYFDQAGDWIALQQMTNDGASAIVPRSKLMNFRTTAKLDNPEGRSALRNCFVPYVRKKTLEISEGRIATRAAGVFAMYLPGKLFDPSADTEDKAAFAGFKQMVQDLANDRRGGVLLPNDTLGENGAGARQYEISILTAGAQSSTDLSPIILRHDQRIAMTMLADFILMGQQAVGSLALSSNKTVMFARATGGFLRVIRDNWNRTLIPKLWALNGFPQATMPTLKYGDFAQRDLDQVSLFITALVKAGAVLFPDDELENKLRAMAELPPKGDDSPDLADGDDIEEDAPDPAVDAETAAAIGKLLGRLRKRA